PGSFVGIAESERAPLRNPSSSYLRSAQQVIHGVEPGGLAGQELGGVERPQREAVTVQRTVGQLEALPHQAEDDGVLAGVIAGAERVQTDLAPGPLTDL